MATSSVSPVSLTESFAAQQGPQGPQDTTAGAIAALQARMERASASLAVELTPEQVETMCEEYGKVLDDVKKGARYSISLRDGRAWPPSTRIEVVAVIPKPAMCRSCKMSWLMCAHV